MRQVFVDTNVLVRLLFRDDEAQLRRAVAFIKQAALRGDELSVPDLVVAELIGVLESNPLLDRAMIADAMMGLVGDPRFTFADAPFLARAISFYHEAKVDFVDACLAAQVTEPGSQAVLSFDHDFKRLPVHWIQP